MIGYIARLRTDRGFGFLKGQDGVDRFFHRSAVQGGVFEDLVVDDEVEFEEEPQSPRGPRASVVRRLTGKRETSRRAAPLTAPGGGQ